MVLILAIVSRSQHLHCISCQGYPAHGLKRKHKKQRWRKPNGDLEAGFMPDGADFVPSLMLQEGPPGKPSSRQNPPQREEAHRALPC